MKGSTRKRHSAPTPLEIGDKILVSFEDPLVGIKQYNAQLQYFTKDGCFCIDAPKDIRPPRGTLVKVSSQGSSSITYTFSSKIRGRKRLRGNLPVIVVRPPATFQSSQRRSAFRISACIQAQCRWREPNATQLITKTAVVTNLSGGGGQVFMREKPSIGTILLTVIPPASYVKAQSRRRWSRPGLARHQTLTPPEARRNHSDKVNEKLGLIQATIVDCRVRLNDMKGTIYALSVAFAKPSEECYQLVHFLERQSICKGLPAKFGHSSDIYTNDVERHSATAVAA